jgi:F-type H+-transporting ATPase subunit delta
MSSRTAGSRYAKALFDVALKESDPAAVERDLEGFAALLAGHAQLARVLTNPAVPAPRKRALLSELISRLDGLAPVTAKLLLLLAERDRFPVFADLVEAYRTRFMDHQKIVRAVVTSAAPLSEDGRRSLEKGLAAAVGKRVTVRAEVDPAIIGGVIARVGSVVFDGSVRRQLERIKEKLVENG